MKISVLLLICTVVLYFVTKLVSSQYGSGTAERFLERNVDYTAESLKTWVKNYRRESDAYAFPVLFPLDLLFMSFLAATLAVASIWLGESITWLREFVWVLLLLPPFYLAVDLSEDALLARFLMSPATITVEMVKIVQALTTLKIYSVFSAVAQVILLMAGALIWRR